MIHLTAHTPGAYAAAGFDPQLSQTPPHCFISLSYLPSASTLYTNLTLSLKETMIKFLKE